MQKFLSRQKIANFSVSLFLAATLAVLAGCGSGTPSSTTTSSGGTTASTTTTTLAAPTPTLTLALTNGGAPVNSISISAPATVTATVLNAAGGPASGVVLTFTVTDPSLATITPSNTRLTNSSGITTITLSPPNSTAAGATTITATGQVTTAGVTTAVNGSAGFSVGSAAAALTITDPVFGVNPLSAFGTTSVSVVVSSNGAPVTTPQTVTFTSTCAGSGWASLTASVLTAASGIATGSYRDINCGSNVATDTVVASVNGITSSAVLTVIPPTVGSIKFISATPTNITLKGTGGAGRQESSIVIFRVVDANDNPIVGRSVTFELSTTWGGITVTSPSDISDSLGYARVTVNSGTASTAVRVIAKTCTTATNPCTGIILLTQSDQLTISTGVPDQDSFTLAATTLNIEGWDYVGTTTVLTAYLADHFNNFPPDGTAVSFTTEGGRVVDNCLTTGGTCSVTLNSQNPQLSNGRGTVLAYAVGEESFFDRDSDGWADKTADPLTNELVVASGISSFISSDMGEAFVDKNENGTWDAGEVFYDYHAGGGYETGDSVFNGVLCNEAASSVAGTCPAGTQSSIHVRDSLVIVFSGSYAEAEFLATSDVSPTTGVSFAVCDSLGVYSSSSVPVTVTIHDVNGNSMPAGSTVTFTSSNGTIAAPSSFIVPNTTSCLNTYTDCPSRSAIPPATGTLAYRVSLSSDATQDANKVCTNPKHNGVLTVTVTTPKNISTSFSIPVND